MRKIELHRVEVVNSSHNWLCIGCLECLKVHKANGHGGPQLLYKCSKTFFRNH